MSEANYYFWGYHDFFSLAKVISNDNPLIAYKSTFVANSNGRLIVTYYVRLADDRDMVIDKYHQAIDLVKGQEVTIGLYDPVPHSVKLMGDGDSITLFKNNLIKVIATSLNLDKLFPETLAATITELNALNRYSFVDVPPTPPTVPATTVEYQTGWVNDGAGGSYPTATRITTTYQIVATPPPNNPLRIFKHYIFAANNNLWNLQTPRADLNYSDAYYSGDASVINRFFTLTSDGLDLTYTMPTSPYLLDLHRTFNCTKWSTNSTNPGEVRADNLGWRIERGNEVLGIQVKEDGTIDEALEKTINRRLHANGSEPNNTQEYNPNCFGSKGILVRYLPNKFSPNGTAAGGYRKVRSIPQLLAEFHEQANAAMGYQEGTAIEIQLDGQTYRYPNQLALLTELFVTAKQTATYSKGSFFSSLIGEQSIKEVIAGLGLRTVDKYLEFSIAGKAVKLYYKGISASQSVRRKLSAVATNVGMIFGNIN